MDWQAALRARAIAAAPVKALLVDRFADRVTWEERKEGVPPPAITLLDVTALRSQHLKGFDGLQQSRVQADVWAASYAAKQALTEALLAALVPPHSGNGVTFTRAMVEGPRDLPERAGEEKVFRKSMDLIVHHRQV